MTTRPLTARLTTATLAAIVGIGLPAFTALMMGRAPATGALPTATLEHVEVVARRIERTAQNDPAAPLGQSSWTDKTGSTGQPGWADPPERATWTLPTGQSARADAPSAVVRRIAM